MEIHLIWAQDYNGGIGENGKLPWHVTEDLKNFKKITLNTTIVMGRKTWDSLPIKPLPKRRNIVISSKKQSSAITYHSLEECLLRLKKDKTDRIFIIGGRSIYKLFFNFADYLHISYINLNNENINEFFPINESTINNHFKKLNEKKLSNRTKYTCWIKK